MEPEFPIDVAVPLKPLDDYNVSWEEQELLDDELQEYIDRGLARKVPKEFAVAVGKIFLLVKPETGKKRLVFDGRQGNFLMHIDSFALPAATNLIDVHWNWAAKIDLKDAFLHFPASEKLMQH